MTTAVIPARGGSKRIPRKNINIFCGKPMIGWSIEAAQQSGCFDRIVVSTDDDEIADVARQCGADVPFKRPTQLADDYAGTQAVIAHAVKTLELSDIEPVCCLYATAPFVRAEDLRRGLQTLQETDARYAFAVTSYAFPIQRAVRINKHNQVEMFQPEHFETRSQDLEEAWHDAGQFYWGVASSWLEKKPLFTDAAAVKLPRYRVQDIDTTEDWARAETLFRVLQAGEMKAQTHESNLSR